MAELESPDSADELYRYRGITVPWARPIFQGDIFDDVTIPGLDDGPGLAMVTTHACSMRSGPDLRKRLLMGRVTRNAQSIALPWKGNFRVMPLPELWPDLAPGHWVLTFEDVGVVPTELLDLGRRVACLDDRGLVLLQQRQAHHFTRYAVETEVLFEQTANVLAEAELLEDWIGAAISEADEAWSEKCRSESQQFDKFVAPLRDDFKDPSRRAGVRRAVNQEIRRRSRR